jgi:hypothetical protein
MHRSIRLHFLLGDAEDGVEQFKDAVRVVPPLVRGWYVSS